MSNKGNSKKVAVVLFNLGGPDSLYAVKPFLFNLFNDKYIIRLPKPLRYLIAWLISSRREKIAQNIYAHTDNKSPIYAQTIAQQYALETKLKEVGKGNKHKVFIAMRHWHPFAEEAIKEIIAYKADQIILLPLYPQFSTTTTASSVEDFKTKWKIEGGKEIPIKTICCYPANNNFIKAHANLIRDGLTELDNKNNFRILFSAHGLPKSIIEKGDPYQWQVENSAKLIVEELAINNLDYKVTYQSKVGPMEWLGPSTEEEIMIAVNENKALVIVPIAFVSEHVETVVELDIEYATIAMEKNIEYLRIPTLSVNDIFIESLATMVNDFVVKSEEIIAPDVGYRICPKNFKDCPCKIN